MSILRSSARHSSAYRFTTYQDARRVRLVDGLIFETNILRVSPVKVAHIADLREALLDARRGTVTHRATKLLPNTCSCLMLPDHICKFTTDQDARRVRLVDGLFETNTVQGTSPARATSYLLPRANISRRKRRALLRRNLDE